MSYHKCTGECLRSGRCTNTESGMANVRMGVEEFLPVVPKLPDVINAAPAARYPHPDLFPWPWQTVPPITDTPYE